MTHSELLVPVGFTDSAMGAQRRRRGSVAALYVLEPATSAELKWLRKHLRALGLQQQQQQHADAFQSHSQTGTVGQQPQQRTAGAAGSGVVPASGFATLTRAFGRHLLGLPLRPRPRSRPASHSPNPSPASASASAASSLASTAKGHAQVSAMLMQQQQQLQLQQLKLAQQKRAQAPPARPVSLAAGVYENENEAPRSGVPTAAANASSDRTRPKVTFRVRLTHRTMFCTPYSIFPRIHKVIA